MAMRLRQRQVARCPNCTGTIDEHDRGCPRGFLIGLRTRQKHLECPTCSAREVGVNKDDYYECRSCGTQYTASGHGAPDDAERKVLIDGGVPIPVLVIPHKGQGNFPLDDAIAKAVEDLERAGKQA